MLIIIRLLYKPINKQIGGVVMEAINYLNLTDEELINCYKRTHSQLYVEKLYYKYKPLLYKLGKKYAQINYLFTFQDLMQEGYLALIKAANEYDPGKSQFISFLFKIVNQHLYGKVNGRTSREQYNYKILKTIISLDKPMGNDEDTTLKETIKDMAAEENFNLPEKLFIAELNNVLRKSLNGLSIRQQEIVKCINGYERAALNQVELAEIYSISKGRVQQILNTSYKKLRLNDDLERLWNDSNLGKEYTPQDKARDKMYK